MKNILKHKNKIIVGVLILVVLAFVFWRGGNFSVNRSENLIETQEQIDSTVTADVETKNYSQVEKQKEENEQTTGKYEYKTEPILQEKPVPVEPQDAEVTDKTLTCTLSVRCDTILNNLECLKEEKVDIVPKDGVIFAEKEVVFYEGESAFNVLLREMKKNKIHFEFVNTPIYNSAYIEGIGNLYEFDCGELSGWMYKVNGWFPGYGCSRYALKQGDKIEWLYTCDLGNDIGGGAWQKDE